MIAAHYLPARYYALLATRLVQWGVDLPRLLHDAGIDPQVLDPPEGRFRPEQVERLVVLASERSGRSDLGFELGRMLKLSSHDILGYAMLSAPSVDQALRLVSRYFSLITPTYSLRYRRAEQFAEVIVQPLLPLSARAREIHLEAIAVAFYEHVRVLLSGTPPACSLHLSYEAPPHAVRYQELSAAVVHFGEHGLTGARIVLDNAVVMRPLAMADDHALRMAKSRCAQLLNHVTEGARLSDWVRMMLGQAADGQPKLEELAQILNLSPRTLERRLSVEGHRFRDLARHARYDRACALLAAGRLSVTQIAYQLGYTDVANFTRAFRRESGMAPSAYRAQVPRA
ncbi:MAG: AraC family transcriptional regulator [Panacagrimonas sp.]